MLKYSLMSIRRCLKYLMCVTRDAYRQLCMHVLDLFFCLLVFPFRSGFVAHFIQPRLFNEGKSLTNVEEDH